MSVPHDGPTVTNEVVFDDVPLNESEGTGTGEGGEGYNADDYIFNNLQDKFDRVASEEADYALLIGALIAFFVIGM